MSFEIVEDPTRGDLMRISEGDGLLRAVRDPRSGKIYAWAARDALHMEVINKLGLGLETRDEVARNSFLFSRQQLEETPDARTLGQLIHEMSRK